MAPVDVASTFIVIPRENAGSPLRIIQFITRGDDMGGAQLHMVHLCERLQSDGHDVLAITGPPGVITDALDLRRIRRLSIPTLQREISLLDDVRSLLALIRRMREFQPDLVACHSSKAGILGRLAARQQSVPVVFTAHGWAFTEGVPKRRRTVYRLLERGFSHLTDRVICVSEFDRHLAIQAGIDPSRLVAIHNGIPDLMQPAQALPNADILQLVMIGRFVPQKDQETVVRAVARLGGVEAHFIGDGQYMPAIVQLAKALGVQDRCHFHGLRFDIENVLNASDVFCLMSNWEGFPIATLEAMRAGRPTIVSRTGGSGEAVIDGGTGFIVERGDVERLSSAIASLSGDRGRLQAFGNAARLRFETEFTFNHMYERTVDVYRAVVRQRVSAARGST